MRARTKWIATLLFAMAVLGFSSSLWSQSLTTAGFNGTVKDNNGQPIYGANVIAKHEPSGSVFGAVSRSDGRFNIPAVRVGGPYSVRVEFIGYKTETIENITLTLGEDRRIEFSIHEEALSMEEIAIVAERNQIINDARTGAAKTVSTKEIQNLPTSTRDFNDYTKYTPQFSSAVGQGQSTAGRNNRYNNIQIDGSVNNDLFGLAASGTPGGQAGTSPISVDAIQEFQVVIAPYDVRMGGFTGGGINAITRSGTNKFEFSGYHLYKNESYVGLSRTGLPATDFTERFSGFRVGGPIMRDKMFFFVNAEVTRREDPSEYGILGDGSQFDFTGVPLDTVNRLVNYLKDSLGYDPGGYNQTTVPITSTKFFARLDYNISDKHRLSIRHNYVKASQDIMRRVTGQSATSSSTGFRLGNAGYIFKNITNSTVFQLNSALTKTLFNEMTVAYQDIDDHRENPGAQFPTTVIRNGSNSQLVVGTEQFSYANSLKQKIFEFTDNVTWYMGAHTWTAGTHNEFFTFENSFLPQWLGRYEFNSVSHFIHSANGIPGNIRSYAVTFGIDDSSFAYDSTSQPSAKFSVQQYGFYLQDKYAVTPNLNLTVGLRFDIPIISDKPTANDTFAITYDTLGGYRTDKVASGNMLFAPRVGFNWDVFNNNKTQVRGGLGIFAGRPAYVWISNQYSNTGADLGSLNLSSGSTLAGMTFDPTIIAIPAGSIGASTINVMDPDFKYPSVTRLNLGIDHELPGGIIATLELLSSSNNYDVMFEDVSLVGVQGYIAGADSTSGERRPRFGTIGNYNYTTGANGSISATRVQSVSATKRYNNVILLRNTKDGSSFNFSAQLQKQVDRGFSWSAAYAYGISKDVTSATSSIAFSNWQFNPVKGDPNNPGTARSNYEQTHRVILSAAQTVEIVPKWTTTFSLFYNGRSGRPYSTTYNGDINADGATTNDLIYVPKDKNDIILVRANSSDTRTADQIWVQLDEYISEDPDLDDARGTIVKRNASTEPWNNRLDLKIVQDIPVMKEYGSLQFTMDMLNVLNMFDKAWGQLWTVSNQNDSPIVFRGLDAATGRPVFSFTPRDPKQFKKNRFSNDNLGSRWAFLLGVRYTF